MKPLSLRRPKPAHVRIVGGQVVETRYEAMPKVPVVPWKSRGSGVVYSPLRTTRRKYFAMRLDVLATRTLAEAQHAFGAQQSRLIRA